MQSYLMAAKCKHVQEEKGMAHTTHEGKIGAIQEHLIEKVGWTGLPGVTQNVADYFENALRTFEEKATGPEIKAFLTVLVEENIQDGLEADEELGPMYQKAKATILGWRH